MSTSTAIRRKSRSKVSLLRVENGRVSRRSDQVATEEPLEIRLEAKGGKAGERKTVAVTMRTPGHDFELALGFLFAEGVIGSREEVARAVYCTNAGEPQQYNIVNVELRREGLPELGGLDRHFFTSSACGVCGKSGLENLQQRCAPIVSGLRVSAGVLRGLPQSLRKGQKLFDSTGGLHAAALFDAEGNLLALREDVGRHNALDKLIGLALMEGRLPLSECMVLVSGRASYELAQKAVAAGVPVLAAVSAPSSLAVEVAEAFGLTLVGFLRESFNVYSGLERIDL
ncbi:MAG: formate dehydrogenase accessory sulfurtransferase FdhD [Meiothermus sp.]|nr:formate dehydrogenase accessory sulfurtransferase FdhD [Meiothermus sp.]